MTDIRSRTEEYLDSLTQEQIDELLKLALLQQKTVWRLITCKHCNRQGKYEVEVPMPSSIAKAIKDLGEFTKGKVPEQVLHQHEWRGELEISQMTDLAMLRALATRGDVVDGEFEELDDQRSLPSGP